MFSYYYYIVALLLNMVHIVIYKGNCNPLLCPPLFPIHNRPQWTLEQMPSNVYCFNVDVLFAGGFRTVLINRCILTYYTYFNLIEY